MITYSDKLRGPKWQRRRLEIMSRDNFSCKYCQDVDSNLNVHHVKYKGAPWEADDKDLETVCEHCHKHVCHNENIIDLIKLEKIKTEWSLIYLINCKDRDILLTIGNDGTDNIMIFIKNSYSLKTISKFNKVK